MAGVLLRISIAVKIHYAMATLIKKIFNWDDLLSVSDVQPIIILMGRMAASRP